MPENKQAAYDTRNDDGNKNNLKRDSRTKENPEKSRFQGNETHFCGFTRLPHLDSENLHVIGNFFVHNHLTKINYMYGSFFPAWLKNLSTKAANRPQFIAHILLSCTNAHVYTQHVQGSGVFSTFWIKKLIYSRFACDVIVTTFPSEVLVSCIR